MRSPIVSRGAMAKKVAAKKKVVNRDHARSFAKQLRSWNSRTVRASSPGNAPTILARNISSILRALQISERGFGKVCGLGPGTIQKILKSGGCNTATLLKIRAATGISLDWLVAGEGKLTIKFTVEAEHTLISERMEQHAPAPEVAQPTKGDKAAASGTLGNKKRK